MTIPRPIKGIYPCGNGFRAFLSIPGAKDMTPVFPTRTEAEAWKVAAEEAKRAGRPIPAPAGARSRQRAQYLTFEEVSELWQNQRRRNRRDGVGVSGIAKADRILHNHILPRLGSRLLTSISFEDIEDFRDHLTHLGLACSYQAKILWAIRSIFAFAGKRGLSDRDPTFGVFPRSAKGSTADRDGADWRATPLGWEISLLVALGLREIFRIGFWLQRICGLRIGEVFGLQLSDWEPNTRTIAIHAQGGKPYEVDEDEGGSTTWRREATKTLAGVRIVVAPEPLAEAIDAYIAKFHEGAPRYTRLIVTPQNGRSYSSYAAEISKVLKAAKIVNERGGYATTHYLRKLALTDMFDAQIPNHVVSYIAGHRGAALEGAANVTVHTYWLGPHAQRIGREFDKVQAHMKSAGLTNLSPPDAAVDGLYITRAEAALEMERSESQIIRYFRETGTASELRTSPDGLVRSMVLRSDLEALANNLASRVTIVDAMVALDLERSSVPLVARSVGVSMQEPRDGRGQRWFTPSDFARLEAAVGEWRRFREEHLTLAESAARLETSVKKIRQMAQLGRLHEVDPPHLVLEVTGHPSWLRISEIDALAALPRQYWLRTVADPAMARNCLSVEETAVMLGLSAGSVRRLHKTGKLHGLALERKGCRIWLDPESVRAYRDGRAKSG